MKRLRNEPESPAGHFVVLALLAGLGYLTGGFFGAFAGAWFAYCTWWLKEIHDDIKKHLVKTDEPTS